MVSVLASRAVDRGFEPRSGQVKDYKIGFFSAKHAVLKRKSKHWLAQNQDSVSEWGDMSIPGLLFQWASSIKSNSACWSSTKRTSSSSSHWKLTCSRHDIAEKIVNIGVKQHSLTHSLTNERTITFLYSWTSILVVLISTFEWLMTMFVVFVVALMIQVMSWLMIHFVLLLTTMFMFCLVDK